MELRHLRYFVAVAEELHFGRAAERLMMSQPPLSRQIKELETELGAVLFERSARRVALTEAGSFFYDETVRTLRSIEAAAESARRIAGGTAGRLRIGHVGSAILGGPLPDALGRLRTDAPGLRIELRVMPTATQVRALLAHEIDAGFVRAPLPEEAVGRVSAERVHRLALVAALPDTAVLAEVPRVRLVELAQEPWVMFPRRHGPRLWDLIVEATREACDEPSWHPTVRQEAREMTDIVGLVATGMGCAVVPGEAAAIRPAGVCYRPIVRSRRHRPLVQDLTMIWRPEDPSGGLRRLRDALGR
ncbi:MAG: LysR substrate-binding domain-containing protein [Planctomycetota bacterium]